jgi:hypothetical protein
MKSLIAMLATCFLTFSASAEACDCKGADGTCEKCEKGQCECDKGECKCEKCDCPNCHKHQHPEKK